MNQIIYNGRVLLDIEKLVNSNTIKGIEMLGVDPGDMHDNKIYIIATNSSGGNDLFIRHNTGLWKIGEAVSSTDDNE